MRVTPLDILRKQFKTAKNGVDGDEVSAFLEQIRESMEDLLRENQRLREEIGRKDAEISGLRDAETDLKQTLVLARRLAEDLERGARREADVILGEARLEAERVLRSASDEHRALQGDVVRLRTSRVRLAAELRAVVTAHGRLLEDLERSFGEGS